MNKQGRIAKITVTALLIIAVCTQAGAAEDMVKMPRKVPATGMEGWDLFHSRVSGTALSVEDAGWPSIRMLSSNADAAVSGTAAGSTLKAGHLKLAPLLFGCVSIGRDGRLREQKANAVTNTLVFGNAADSLSVTVTRLSPAVLLQSKADTLEFFGLGEKPIHTVPTGSAPPIPGMIKPLRWATPGPDGAIVTGVLGEQVLSEMPFKSWTEHFARAETAALGQASQPPLAQLGKTWLLLWYGSDSPFVGSAVSSGLLVGDLFPNQIRMKTFQQVDVPMLLVFEKAPKAITLRGEGQISRFLIEFDDGAGSIAMLPVCGQELKPAAETEKWLTDFPQKMKARCEAWAGNLSAFPVNVKETFAYDPGKDRLTCTETVEFVPVRPGGQKLSPIPSMLGLAISQGLPVKLSGDIVDMQAPTQFGPTLAVAGDAYSWSMDALGKGVNSRRVVGPANAKAAELQKELVAEVDKVLAAGHLAPWITFMRRYAFILFQEPSESLYLLSELLPLLPPDRQEKLKTYLENEYRAYPPEQGKPVAMDDGARRGQRKLSYKKYENYTYVLTSSGSPRYIGTGAGPTLYGAHGVSRYYDAVEKKPSPETVAVWKKTFEASLEGRDWATMGWLWGTRDKCRAYNYTYGPNVKASEFVGKMRNGFFAHTLRDVNRDAAGTIGYLRLCRKAGADAGAETWGRLAQLTALRFALARYGRYLATSGLFVMPTDAGVKAYLARSADFSLPENHMQQPMSIDQHGVQLLNAVSREPSQYQASNTRGLSYGTKPAHELRFLEMAPAFAGLLKGLGLRDDAKRHLDFFESFHSTWYYALADNLHIRGAELAYMYPTDAHQMFLAHAWIAGTPPEKLEKYIDQPWTPVGDLYYMHKLAETIKAYRSVRWELQE
jgi:hypothetical protein